MSYRQYNAKFCKSCHRILAEICNGLYCHTCHTFSEKDRGLYDYEENTASSSEGVEIFLPLVDRHTHNQDKVKVGQYEIWCSEVPEEDCKRENPDLGIYLSDVWMNKVSPIWSTGTSSGINFGLSLYPAVFCDWKDMDVPEFEVLCHLVNYAWTNIQQGKKVEIGCYGGHGRTGTLLACIMIKAEHIGGQEAINKVRTEYCKKAIETKKQEDLIKKYAEHVNGNK